MARAGTCNIICLLLALCLVCGIVSANQTILPAPTPAGSMAAPYEIRIFSPDRGSIHSNQINDALNGRNGTDLLFATSFGLSTYNGSWSTRHITRENISEGLLDDFITALEYDPDGNLWIGYSGGIQIFDGRTYLTIRDQELLKDPRINALQRWGDTMWIATGNAGLHRYRNGNWSWFQPMSKGGPGFYEIDSMTVDPAGDTLLIATDREGIWTVSSPDDPVIFRRVDIPADMPPPLLYVRQNPQGGGYFFNSTSITQYSDKAGWIPILSVSDLTQSQVDINDIAAGSDGTLYIGTDDGIFIWKDGTVIRHLGGLEGIGPSSVVQWIFADIQGRVWFTTQAYVGYYLAVDTPSPVLTIQLTDLIPSQEPTTPATTAPTPTEIPVVTQTVVKPVDVKEPSLLEHLAAILKGILSKFGI